MILVVGATGEVGSGVVRRLRDEGADVVAMVRPTTDPSALAASGAEIRRGDLLDRDSLEAACRGITTIVATANAIVPRRGERPDLEAIGRGYEDLGHLAREAGVERMILASVPASFLGRGAPEFDIRAGVEERLRTDGPPLTLARASLFMESWLAAVGSRLPLRGGHESTLNRGYWMARMVGATTQRTLDRFGLAQLPGGGRARHAFISSEDVAAALASAALAPDGLPEELRLGGPAALSWREVADTYGRVLHRKVRKVRVPGLPFRALSVLSRPFSPSAAHLLAVQHLVGTLDTDYPPDDARELLGRDAVSVEAFLSRKLRIRPPLRR
jgi:nucleoside-diphosphate-sugar epimerase